MSKKAVSIVNFHFDQVRSGKVLSKWISDSGKTREEMARETGISVHTVNNMIYGKVADLKIDFVFKIAVVTGHSVCEYIALMLKEEEIDFADKIHVLRDKEMELVPYTSTLEQEAKPIPPLSDDAKAVYDRMIKQMEEKERSMSASVGEMSEAHKEQLKAVIASAEKSRADAIAAKDEIIAHLSDTIRRMRRKSAMLTSMLTLETIVIILVIIADIVNPNIGWILGRLFNIGEIYHLRG